MKMHFANIFMCIKSDFNRMYMHTDFINAHIVANYYVNTYSYSALLAL